MGTVVPEETSQNSSRHIFSPSMRADRGLSPKQVMVGHPHAAFLMINEVVEPN